MNCCYNFDKNQLYICVSLNVLFILPFCSVAVSLILHRVIYYTFIVILKLGSVSLQLCFSFSEFLWLVLVLCTSI